MIPIDWNPARKTLAEFAEAGLFVLGMVAAPLALLRGRPYLAVAFWGAAVLIRGVGLVRPGWLRPVYLGLVLATWPIGQVVSRVTLALLYLVAFVPLALVFRLIGRDALRRAAEPALPTYWEPYQPNRGLERYLRPF